MGLAPLIEFRPNQKCRVFVRVGKVLVGGRVSAAALRFSIRTGKCVINRVYGKYYGKYYGIVFLVPLAEVRIVSLNKNI